ncbi:MAG: hypothetical protein JWO79_591 [Actinomycetia bacterium]|nr:hypothetical protein [Actinomycetes bacterium]MDQ1656424.1 hypothetical protein [Cryptosporangiaceae bacterium]
MRPDPATAPSDPLIWELARRAMSDHSHDNRSADGLCRRCGRSWPCGAWQRADDLARQLRVW